MNFVKRIKRISFKLFLLSGVNKRYSETPATFSSITSADPSKIFIFVTAYNEPELIALHYAAVKKFLASGYEYFVIDNSNQDGPSAEIKKFCLEHAVNYVRLPKNPGLDGSLSQGLALNWVYRNIVQKYKPWAFGTMDSDLYPVRSVDLAPIMKAGGAWGIITDRTLSWRLWIPAFYLWPGLAMYRLDWFEKHTENYLPIWGFDTGGRIRVQPKEVWKLPGVSDLFRSPIPEIAPGVFLHEYGDFIHFQGSFQESKAVLDIKKQWLKNIL